MAKIEWNHRVADALNSSDRARAFVRVATPRGWRTKLKQEFGRKLEGHCFFNAMQIAWWHPDTYWYCEGYAAGLPHAWLGLKKFNNQVADEDWALDPTWMWHTKHLNVHPSKMTYVGLRFEVKEIWKFLKTRQAPSGEFTSISALKIIDEVLHLAR